MTIPRHILVVGQIDRAEFALVRQWLEKNEIGMTVTRQDRLQVAAGDLEPDLVLVCQSWPDEFSRAETTAAFGRWPLALWCVCYGAWCASDGRTRSEWPLSARVPAEEVTPRLNRLWRILREQRESPLPLTASRDEIFGFDVACRAIP